MTGQSWNAASFLLAHHLLSARTRLFPLARQRPAVR
jgi:hypothetical protein